jgi:hypothetical protein
MTVRAQYSLRELLYWLTVWCIALAVLSTIIPTAVGTFFLAIWFIGTTVANQVFRYRAGFVYASLLGAICLPLIEILVVEYQFNQSLQPRYDRMVIVLALLGLVLGSIIWIIAVCFDGLYRRISRSRPTRDKPLGTHLDDAPCNP